MTRKAVFHDAGVFDDGSPLDLSAVSGLDAHIADTTDAHDASAISFSPTGTIASTDVQAAIAEVASEATGGAVSSVFTRTGAVVAASGDYTAAQVTAQVKALTRQIDALIRLVANRLDSTSGT